MTAFFQSRFLCCIHHADIKPRRNEDQDPTTSKQPTRSASAATIADFNRTNTQSRSTAHKRLSSQTPSLDPSTLSALAVLHNATSACPALPHRVRRRLLPRRRATTVFRRPPRNLRKRRRRQSRSRWAWRVDRRPLRRYVVCGLGLRHIWLHRVGGGALLCRGLVRGRRRLRCADCGEWWCWLVCGGPDCGWVRLWSIGGAAFQSYGLRRCYDVLMACFVLWWLVQAVT